MPGTTMLSPLRNASRLWLIGFTEAVCVHRVFILCYRSRNLAVRAGQCFIFNGLIFLGSVYSLKSFVIPAIQWILPDHCPHADFEELCSSTVVLGLYSILRNTLIRLLYILWFYPLYAFSIILSAIWYNDIAKHAYIAMGKPKIAPADTIGHDRVAASETTALSDKPRGLEGVMIGIAEQVYSLLLLSCFFLEVCATGLIPFVGKSINFLLLSWMYAYYCFEYKWNLSEVSLSQRLDFFESNWPFFAGFGSPCVLAIFFLPPLESYAVMATLFPLFVVTATDSKFDIAVISKRQNWASTGLRRLPVFYIADTISLKILSLFSIRHPSGHDKSDEDKAS